MEYIVGCVTIIVLVCVGVYKFLSRCKKEIDGICDDED